MVPRIRQRPIPSHLALCVRPDGAYARQQQGLLLDSRTGALWAHYGVPAILQDGNGDYISLNPTIANIFPAGAWVREFVAWVSLAGAPATFAPVFGGDGTYGPMVGLDPSRRPSLLFWTTTWKYLSAQNALTLNTPCCLRWRVTRGADGSTLLEAWINGTYAGQESTATAQGAGNGQMAILGARTTGASYPFNGSFTNLVMFQAALTDAEYTALQADPRRWQRNTFGGKLIDGWLCNEGANGTITSQGGVVGTIAGGEWTGNPLGVGNRWTNAAGAGDSFARGRLYLTVPEFLYLAGASTPTIGANDFSAGVVLTDVSGLASGIMSLWRTADGNGNGAWLERLPDANSKLRFQIDDATGAATMYSDAVSPLATDLVLIGCSRTGATARLFYVNGTTALEWISTGFANRTVAAGACCIGGSFIDGIPVQRAGGLFGLIRTWLQIGRAATLGEMTMYYDWVRSGKW